MTYYFLKMQESGILEEKLKLVNLCIIIRKLETFDTKHASKKQVLNYLHLV